MNEFDKGLIFGALNDVTVTRVVTESYANRSFKMKMSCDVRDENEKEVYMANTIYTNNMIKLRALIWYNNCSAATGGSRTFTGIDGTTFTGYYGTYESNYGGDCVSLYSSSILAYSPLVYISSNKEALTLNDYTIPDDAIAITWSTPEQSVVDADGISTVLHIYYTNDSTKNITVNKILIAGQIATSSISSSTSDMSSALLFEELLDTSIIIKSGGRFARDYVFRLDC